MHEVKCYKLWDPVEKKIFMSKGVVFDENRMIKFLKGSTVAKEGGDKEEDKVEVELITSNEKLNQKMQVEE